MGLKDCLLILIVFLFAYARVTAQTPDTLAVPVSDSLALAAPDSLALAAPDSLALPAIDSLRIPQFDSTGKQLPDSLGYIYHLDSLGFIQVDSLGYFMIDSLATFSKKEMKQFARQKRREEKAIADSIYKSTFHTLETYVVPDSLKHERFITWTHESHFNKLTFKDVDTNIQSHFYDYAHMKKDVGAVYLGTAGSPTLPFHYFNRERREHFDFWSVGMEEAYDKETLPAYNTKSPYTVMSYSGTFFSHKEKEELNVGLLHTQNLSPETNIQFYYKKIGTKGLLQNESTNTRTLAFTANHLGKRYVMHAGYIRNSLNKAENGGIKQDSFILDTLLDARTIPVLLANASSALSDNQLFVTQSIGLPIQLFKRDTLKPEDGTVVYLGHAGHWNTMSRSYSDEIALNDKDGRDFYHNNFYLDPVKTRDSVQTMVLDNRFFLRIQPWSSAAILSGLEGGVGYTLLSHYYFLPDYYTGGLGKQWHNAAYAYAGAYGMLKKYFAWNATGKLHFAGYYIGDMSLDATMRFSFYPLPSGIHLTGNFLFHRKTPDYFEQQYYSNHFLWNNAFEKTTNTRINATLSIPHWRTKAAFNYGLIGHPIYYDTLGTVRQTDKLVNIITATLSQDIKFWYVRLENRLLFQFSSHPDIIPLPLVAANLRYYLEIPVVKDVMTAQIGADITFHTAYYMNAYNPALGQFHVQREAKYGNTPYIDAFVNLKWKRATIYVKYLNAAQGWPTGDYFSAPHYIRPQRVVKIGITWPFYVQPLKAGKSESSTQDSEFKSQNTSHPTGGLSVGRPVR